MASKVLGRRRKSCGRRAGLSRGRTTVFDFLEMLAKAGENCFLLAFRDFAFELRQREMNDVVMVDFLALQFFRSIASQTCAEIDFLRRQIGASAARDRKSVPAPRRNDFQSHARSRFWHSLPGQADFMRLLGRTAFSTNSPTTMDAERRLAAERRMPSHKSFAAATARRTGFPSFSAMARTFVKRSCSIVLKSCSGPDRIRRRPRDATGEHAEQQYPAHSFSIVRERNADDRGHSSC